MSRSWQRRFWSFVKKTDTCWIWTGASVRGGYGNFEIKDRQNRTTVGVHRLAYEILVGKIPRGRELDHLCRNRLCVNPKHLEPVTHIENLLRSPIAPAAVNHRKTRCKHGHSFVNNIYFTPDGRRQCRICIRRRKREWRLRQLDNFI